MYKINVCILKHNAKMKPNLVNIKMNLFYVIINYGTF